MRNIKATVSYNGRDFCGWQKQNGKRTVQGVLEQALFDVTGEKICIEGSGRTDKGVHALGQVCSFSIENSLPLKNLKKALNNILPEDVYVKKVELAKSDFHARFSAKKKTYCYFCQAGGERDAISFDRVGYYPYKVDFEKIVSASKLFVGKHNFKGFCASGAQVQTFEREIFDINVKKKGKLLKFTITGNGFLYNMVRIIVGTLLDVGRGKLSENDVKKALLSQERKYAGVTMSPNGLFLVKVEYEEN